MKICLIVVGSAWLYPAHILMARVKMMNYIIYYIKFAEI
mgnify:CR=1 FL=1